MYRPPYRIYINNLHYTVCFYRVTARRRADDRCCIAAYDAANSAVLSPTLKKMFITIHNGAVDVNFFFRCLTSLI